MKSLAVLVLIIFLIDIVAGPIAIALTWPKLVNAISSQSKGVSMVLTVFRRLVHGLLVTIGFFIGSWLAYIAEPPAKLFGIASNTLPELNTIPLSSPIFELLPLK